MKFSLLVLSHPCAESSWHAYQFAKAVVNGGHQLYRVFFYREGVLNSINSTEESYSVNALWQQLGLTHNIDLSVCSTAALKRGINTPGNDNKPSASTLEILPGFTLAGLGQLSDADVDSDRLITFG